MRICSVDTTLNEELPAKQIVNLIDSKIAQVETNIVRKKVGGIGLDRKTLEKSHVLFITLPRKKITQEIYIELISYIDIGGTLILTLPSPPWEGLGRFFEEMIKELGISFQSKYVYGLPKIPSNTRLIGSKLTITKAHVIEFNVNKNFLKENGIKKYVPLALMDKEPVILAGYKRRGKFVIISSPEVFTESNSDFLNRLVLLSSQKIDYILSDKIERYTLGDGNFSLQLQHGSLQNYLLSLYHHNFMFLQKEILFISKEDLTECISKELVKQKVLGDLPSKQEIMKILEKLKWGD
ncbi:MAG: hypothetical protein KGD64_08870 [Candidatus Heimdallarchaeota archaeon]|nr:hypothetical protein [Candidatus Heimdallarchaeota archaeon]